jgi:hypothetical protein
LAAPITRFIAIAATIEIRFPLSMVIFRHLDRASF